MIKLLSWHTWHIVQYSNSLSRESLVDENKSIYFPLADFLYPLASSIFSLQDKCYGVNHCLPSYQHGCTIPFPWIAQKDPRCVGEVHAICFLQSLWIFLNVPAATWQMFVEIRNAVSSQDIYFLVISTWVDEYNCATKIRHEEACL